MSFTETDLAQPRVTPAMFVGVASPLWAYFGAAAAGGLAYWWMTRWARPENLETFFNAAALAVPTREAVEKAVVEPVATLMQAAMDATPPVGGESAPVSPLVAEPETPTVAVETEAAAEEPAEPEPAPAKKAKKSDEPSPTVN